MIDYSISYRRQVKSEEIRELSRGWSLFLSAYNDSERVRSVFDEVGCERHWIVHPEYRYAPEDLPTGEVVIAPTSLNEAEFWNEYLSHAGGDPFASGDFCVDLTGFMRPHLMLLVQLVKASGAKRFTALYTDPDRYEKQENTSFSKGPVEGVRQVAGFEGVHVTDTSNDLLIVGPGFDDELVRRVGYSKERARQVHMFGLPSLQPEMYQQNVLMAARAAESTGRPSETVFAPANDPFVTAQVLQELVDREEGRRPVTNLYLASLATKPQALGFALYYVTEHVAKPTSILFPYATSYARETTVGVKRTWLYSVEFLG